MIEFTCVFKIGTSLWKLAVEQSDHTDKYTYEEITKTILTRIRLEPRYNEKDSSRKKIENARDRSRYPPFSISASKNNNDGTLFIKFVKPIVLA